MLTPSESGGYFSVLVLAIFIVNIVFSVIVNVLGENGKKDAYKYVSFSLGSIVICVVTILYVSIVKADICYSLKIKKPHPKYFLYSAMALFACVFGLSGVNNAFINFLSDTFGYSPVVAELPSFTPLNYSLTVFCVCVLPALFEEVAFRGALLSGLNGVSPIYSALITGFMFSLFHMNPAQTPYQFVVGFVFALLSIDSGSIFPSASAHFLNNFIIVNSGYFLAGVEIPNVVNIVLTVAGLLILCVFIWLSLRNAESLKNGNGNNAGLKPFLKYSAFGVAICLIVWMAGLT